MTKFRIRPVLGFSAAIAGFFLGAYSTVLIDKMTPNGPGAAGPGWEVLLGICGAVAGLVIGWLTGAAMDRKRNDTRS